MAYADSVAPTAEGIPDLDKVGPQPSFMQTYGFPMMMLSGLAAGIGDIVAGENQAASLRTQAKYKTWAAGENIHRAQTQTQQVQQQTDAQIAANGNRANSIVGAQRAGYANQGVNVNSGTPLALQVQTGEISNIDALTIRNNAALKAWGIQTSAQNEAAGQKFGAISDEAEAQQSLALGGAKVAGQVLRSVDTYNSRSRGF